MSADKTSEIRGNYTKNRVTSNRSKSNTALSGSRTPVGRSTSNKIITNRNSAFGSSKKTDLKSRNDSRTPDISANIRRAATNKQNKEKDEEEEIKKPQPSSKPAEPETGSRLEPPPMPPGL
jgi:hypothetical protein